MKIRTTMRYHLSPVQMALIKKKKIEISGKEGEKEVCSYTVNGKEN